MKRCGGVHMNMWMTRERPFETDDDEKMWGR
jgi:hypothetical protein